MLNGVARYTKSDSDPAILDNTARHFFPRLLQIAQQVSSSDPSDGYQVAQQGTLLRLVLKAYKHCIASTLTPALSESSSLLPWGTFFLSLVSKPLPVAHMPESEEDRQKHPWSKAKKWAHWCLNQLFERYGNPPQLQKGFQEKYGAFADVFIQQFAPEILKAYLNEVERSVQGEWIPRKAKHYVLRFFEEWFVGILYRVASMVELTMVIKHSFEGNLGPAEASRRLAPRALHLPTCLPDGGRGRRRRR